MTLDIRIGGGVDPVGGSSGGNAAARPGEAVEASIISIRRARRGGAKPGHQPQRRRSGQARDPSGAYVVTLLVARGDQLPRGLAARGWRAVVRFLRR